VVLDDISLHDIIGICKKDESIKVNQTKKYFKPNGRAHHTH
jgi:urease accessory protein